MTVAGVSFTTDGTVKTLGDAAQGVYGIINYSSTLDTPENKTFVKAWTRNAVVSAGPNTYRHLAPPGTWSSWAL